MAHEVGHIVLHAEVFKPYGFRTVAQWQKFVEGVDETQWEYLEHHANVFAAQVLMPTGQLVRIHERCAETIRREAPTIAEDPAGSQGKPAPPAKPGSVLAESAYLTNLFRCFSTSALNSASARKLSKSTSILM